VQACGTKTAGICTSLRLSFCQRLITDATSTSRIAVGLSVPSIASTLGGPVRSQESRLLVAPSRCLDERRYVQQPPPYRGRVPCSRDIYPSRHRNVNKWTRCNVIWLAAELRVNKKNSVGRSIRLTNDNIALNRCT